MLSLWRRHEGKCPHKAKGRSWTKCSCPVWSDGEFDGRRIRQSLETRDWARAGRKLARLEDELSSPVTSAQTERSGKSVAEATEAFLAQREVEPSTMRKYRRVMNRVVSFAEKRGESSVADLALEWLDEYRVSRNLCPLSWSKELQLLRTFFEFCLDRGWASQNPAKKMRMPPNPKPKPRQPYTKSEIISILAATETFGKCAYERLRARAMVLLLRFYGLRVSDVATLRRDRVSGNQIFLHALKNGAAIWLPLYREVKQALDRLPIPQGATQDCPYYFWTGLGERDGHVKTIDRTLKAVFAMSKVPGAHAHRFRHTLATEILVAGGSIEDVANVLGDSPDVIREHYAKWSPEYQRRTVDLLSRVHGTSAAREEFESASSLFSTGRLVLEVGVEPTCPVKGAGF